MKSNFRMLLFYYYFEPISFNLISFTKLVRLEIQLNQLTDSTELFKSSLYGLPCIFYLQLAHPQS